MAFLLTMGAAFCVAQTASQPAVEPGQKMTDATVVQMVQQKIAPDLIILAISKCTPAFQLDPASTQYMLQMGVSNEIFKAMAAKQMGQAIPGVQPATSTAPSIEQLTDVSSKPRVFMLSASKGNTWNAHRNQSMELGRDFERVCPEVRITVNEQMADYTVALNHIEVGWIARDNQVQVSDRNGDVLSTKQVGSINNGAKKACAMILENWNGKKP
jgi:hypothetical protein